MDDKSRAIMGLEAVRQQYESEITTDLHSIKELLRDPGISPPAEGESVSYGVHLKFHHLAVHKVALIEVERMISEFRSEE